MPRHRAEFSGPRAGLLMALALPALLAGLALAAKGLRYRDVQDLAPGDIVAAH